MFEREITDIFAKYGLPVGSCSFAEVSFLKEDTRFKRVLTVAFPYWFELSAPHNISMYAMLPDYHKVLGKILEDVVSDLKKIFPENLFASHVDVSPVNEKKAAVLSGLGFIGKNTLLINEKYGSFLFLGDICTDAEIFIENEIVANGCGDCSRCIKACPGHALGESFCSDNCVSAITQKKGELSEHEKILIGKSGYVWGCDICSLVCPYNKKLEKSHFAEKYEQYLLYNITEEFFLGFSNREFKRKYANRAFSWKGLSVLRRNFEVLRLFK